MTRATCWPGVRPSRRSPAPARKATTENALDRDLAQPFEYVTPALNQVGQQLAVQAKEWFLAEVVRIGMTDGPLSDVERQAAQAVAADLGMTQAQAYGVISMTERAATAE